MGNIPIHPQLMRLNMWTLDKKLLLWRTLSVSACIIGTAVYMRPLEPYLEAPFFGVLVPTFITGYILVHSSDIMLLVMRTDYVYLETCFATIGAIGSLVCGIYQLCKWIDWMVNLTYDSDGDYEYVQCQQNGNMLCDIQCCPRLGNGTFSIPELVLALAFALHFVSLCAIIIHRLMEKRESHSNDTIET